MKNDTTTRFRSRKQRLRHGSKPKDRSKPCADTAAREAYLMRLLKANYSAC